MAGLLVSWPIPWAGVFELLDDPRRRVTDNSAYEDAPTFKASVVNPIDCEKYKRKGDGAGSPYPTQTPPQQSTPPAAQ
jgi:hypothetical protein